MAKTTTKQRVGRFTKKAKLAYRAWKWKKRLEAMKRLLDEETRVAATIELTESFVPSLLRRVLGRSATGHPYWLMHKAHFKVFRTCVQASESIEVGRRQLRQADEVARRIDEQASKAIRQYRMNGKKWREFEAVTQDLVVARSIFSNSRQFYGSKTKDDRQLGRQIARLESRQCELFDELIAYWAMLETDRQLVIERMARYRAKVKEVGRKRDNFSRVFAGAERRDDLLRQINDGSPEQRAQLAVAKVWNLAWRWAKQADRYEAAPGR